MEEPVFLNATQMDGPAEGIDAVRLGATVLPENPFVGLRPFEAKEAVLFFGRRDQTKELLGILHASRFVAVVGGSGCGKSSLIRAGLIPNLQAGFVAGSVDRWNIITMKPGNSPLLNLAAALLNAFRENSEATEVEALVEDIRLSGVSAVTSFLEEQTKGVKTNFLLLVDQFEEIFRFASNDDAVQTNTNQQLRETCREEATDLVSIMLDLVVQESMPVYVVMTMRSDFLGECDAFYGLPEAMNRSQYLVPRLTRQQRQKSIENPVLLYGAAISDRLTDCVLNDMEEERDQLPIMQHALMRTWEKWQLTRQGPLDLVHYNDAGTVAEALSRDAEDALQGLSGSELIIAERMFQALTTTDAKGRRLRRPTRLSKLAMITGSREVVLKLIDRFRSNNRSFLVLSEDPDPLVDISHESLIRQWSTLREWVDDEVTSRELYLRLATDAVRHKADEVPLWSDPALQLALNWWCKRNPTEAWGCRYHQEFKLTERFLRLSEQKRTADALQAERLKNEQVRREREDLEKAQRQAEVEKQQAEELAAARQRELQSAQMLYRQRAKTIRRTRLLALVLFVTLLGVGLTAAWAFRAQAQAKRSAADANEAKSLLEKQQDELKKNRDDLLVANARLKEETDKAYRAQKTAEAASAEADRQASVARSEKGKALAALKKADQTAAADELRRKAASEQNAAEIEEAQETYLKAAEAYEKINNKEGVAYTYSELGNMLIKQEDTSEVIHVGRRADRERWDQMVQSNWVDGVLLSGRMEAIYFSTIGLTRAHARGLAYYADAIKAYRQAGGVSGLNGAAAVFDKVGNVMSSASFEDEDEPELQAFAATHRALAARDSYCAALDSYKRADNSKGQIAVLTKMGDALQGEQEEEESEEGSDKGVFKPNVGGCPNLGNDAATYYEQAATLYPAVLKRYQHGSNQLKKNQESFVGLLMKLGRLYNQQAHQDGTLNQPRLNRAIAKFDQAAKVYQDDKDVDKTARTLRMIADALDEDDLRSRYYDLAVAEYHGAGRIDEEAELLKLIGRRYAAGRPDDEEEDRPSAHRQALKYLERALRLYQQRERVEEYSLIYSLMGSNYAALRKQDEALAAYESALANSLKLNDPKALPRDFYNVARIQETKGQREEAQKSYEMVLRVAGAQTGAGAATFRRYAQAALKRLRGEEPSPTPTPSTKETPKPQSSPSPGKPR